MSPQRRASERRLLDELTRINNDYGVLQRSTLQDLARNRQSLSQAQGLLGAVVHDMRTPLQAVLGFAEFLLDEDLEPRQRDLVERIARSGKVMADLTDDLLESVASGATALDVETLDLATLLDEVVAHYNLLAQRPGVRVELATPASRSVEVVGSASKLRRMLDNLIGNAVKFSPEGGTVHASLSSDAAGVLLTVSDEGPGIDPSQHDAVFAPFHRASGTVAVPGVGLGLAIVKQIVERHGGSIAIDSRLGEGATFTVRLPPTSP